MGPKLATRKFSDNFDSYSTGALPTSGSWDQDGAHAMAEVVTSAADGGDGPRSGANMLRGNWTGTPKDFTTARISLGSLYTDEGFIRVRFRFDANLSHPASGSSVHMLRFFQTGFSFFLSSPNGTNWQLEGTWDGVSDQLGSASIPQMDDGAWHTFELYWKVSTGVLKAWVDGTLEMNVTGTFGADPSTFFIVSNMGGDLGDNTNYVYFDDFEFYSDASDGEAATGSMSDASITVGEGGGEVTVRKGSSLGGLG